MISNTHQGAEPTEISQFNMEALVQKLISQDQRSRVYQSQLEAKIQCDNISYQRVWHYSAQLQQTIDALQCQQNMRIRNAAGASDAIARELALERQKVQELEARVISFGPLIETAVSRAKLSDDSQERQLAVVKENETQREIIASLQSTLQARESLAVHLNAALAEAIRELNEYERQLARSDSSSDIEIVTD